jgi:hypothetical protein
MSTIVSSSIQQLTRIEYVSAITCILWGCALILNPSAPGLMGAAINVMGSTAIFWAIAGIASGLPTFVASYMLHNRVSTNIKPVRKLGLVMMTWIWSTVALAFLVTSGINTGTCVYGMLAVSCAHIYLSYE